MNSAKLPTGMVLIEIELPDDLSASTINAANLPPKWDAAVASNLTKDIGTRWVQRNESAIFIVPSVVIPRERNYLLNPKHPDFFRIKFKPPEPFAFDPRLK